MVGQGSKHDLLCIGIQCKMLKKVLSLQDKEVAAVRDYLDNESLCRWQLLLQYFDPSLVSTLNDPLICCDVCAEKCYSGIASSILWAITYFVQNVCVPVFTFLPNGSLDKGT